MRSSSLCRPLLAIWQEKLALMDHDDDAQEEDRSAHQAMEAEWIPFAVALTKAARPVTAVGIRLLAEAAILLLADRNDDERLMPPDTFLRLGHAVHAGLRCEDVRGDSVAHQPARPPPQQTVVTSKLPAEVVIHPCCQTGFGQRARRRFESGAVRRELPDTQHYLRLRSMARCLP